MRLGQRQAKGYWENDFEQTFRRYIPRGEMEALRAELAAAAELNAPGTGSHADGTPPGPETKEGKPDRPDQKEDKTGEHAGIRRSRRLNALKERSRNRKAN